MGGRFDPVRDSVTRSPPYNEERRSVSISEEYAHRPTGTRSASIVDILNEGGNHDAPLARSGSGSGYGGDQSMSSGQGYYGTGNHMNSSPSQYPASSSGFNQHHAPSPGSNRSRLPGPAYGLPQQHSPATMHIDISQREDGRHGAYNRRLDHSPHVQPRNSPPTSSSHAYSQPSPSGSQPAPPMRTERSPSLHHLLNVNSSLDENRRPSSSGSSNHGLGPPYHGNHAVISPTIQRPSRLSNEHVPAPTHLRADSMEMPTHHHSHLQQQQYNSHHHHPLHHPQDRSSSIRASSSSGSGGEFAVPELPYRSPESMRGRVPLPPTGSTVRDQSPYGHPTRASPIGAGGSSARYPEHDVYGRPIPSDYLNERIPGGRPTTPPHTQQHYDRNRPPHHLHIDPNGPYHYSQSPVGVPQTPYSNVAAHSPVRPPTTPGGFAPTPGEHYGTPFFAGGRYPDDGYGHRGGPEYAEHEMNLERSRMVSQEGRRFPPDLSSMDRMQYEEDRRMAYDRAMMEEEQVHARQMQEYREREDFEAQERIMEREKMMEQKRMMEQERIIERENAAAEAAREEGKLGLRQENKARPSPPPPKKRKSVAAVDEKKRTVQQRKVKELPIDEPPIVPSNGGSINETWDANPDAAKGKDKKEKQTKKTSEKNVTDSIHMSSGREALPMQYDNSEAKEIEVEVPEVRKPAYKPTIRVSRPGTVRLPITVVELERLRSQCKNSLRIQWEDENQGKADGWDTMIGEIEASKGKVNGQNAITSAKKRKRLTDGQMNPSAEAEVDNPSLVAAHYNSRADAGREARKQSPIIDLKNFNNWIKSVLIQQYGRRNGRVFDVGGGKGGDLKKWEKCGIEELVLADIAEISVQQAEERFLSQRHRFKAEFFAMDCFGEPVEDHIPSKLLMPLFDTVSLQFCLHYGWDTLSHAELMLENLAKYLKPGGTFIATFPDCDELHARLSHAVSSNPDAKSFGNHFYNVKFDQVSIDYNHQIQFEPFGQRYTFELIDAIDNVAEYVVDWRMLEDMAKKFGLRCIYHENFAQVWNEIGMRQGPFRDLARRFGIRIDQEVPMNPDLWEAVTVYAAVAFEKE